MHNGLINLFLNIIVIGVGLGVINRFIPMAGPFQSILNFLGIAVSFIFILQFFQVIQPILPMIQFVR